MQEQFSEAVLSKLILVSPPCIFLPPIFKMLYLKNQGWSGKHQGSIKEEKIE